MVNPELIPDYNAYSVVFRLLSSYKNELERGRLTAYIEQVLRVTDKDDIEAMFSIAQEYKNRMSFVEEQADAIKEHYHPTHLPFSEVDLVYLEKLDMVKEAIIGDLIKITSLQIGTKVMDLLHETIQERVKRRIKLHLASTGLSFQGFISTYSDLWADTESGAANEDLYICACAVGDLDPSSPSHSFYTQVRLTTPQGRITSALVYGGTPGLSVSAITLMLMTWQPADTGNYFTQAIYVSECPSWPSMGSSYASSWFGVSYIAMSLDSVTPAPNGPIYTYKRVDPCDVTCRNMLQHTTNINRGQCLKMAVPYGPLGCFVFSRIISNTSCICADTSNN
jgi:hypothetical protein